MEPIEHYKPFIETMHQHIVLIYHSNGKLSISSYRGYHDDIDTVVVKLHLLDHIYLDTCENSKIISRFEEKITDLNPIDLLILHDDYPGHDNYLSDLNHLDLLKIAYKYCADSGVVFCNAGNVRSLKKISLTAKITRFFTRNILAHLYIVNKSGFKVKSMHSIVAINGFPDKIISMSHELRRLYYTRTQPQRSLYSRILVAFMVYVGLEHLFEPGYLFKLKK